MRPVIVCVCVCVCVGGDNVARLTVASFLKKKVTRLAHLFTFPSNLKAKKENGWGGSSNQPFQSPPRWRITHTHPEKEKRPLMRSREILNIHTGGVCWLSCSFRRIAWKELVYHPIFVLRKKREGNPSSSSQRRYEFFSRIENKKVSSDLAQHRPALLLLASLRPS